MSAKHAYALEAELREGNGKAASRRLRRQQDRIPAILYGGGEAPTRISLDHKKVMHILENDGVFSHLLTLNLPQDTQQVVLKAVQRHHFKKAIFHLDFMRVKGTDIITMKIPLHFLGEAEAPGVLAGGVVNHRLIDIEVKCQANALPESIEVDISKMELDQTLHISDLKLPKNVESLALSHGVEHDHAVVSIHMPRVIVEEETPVAAPEAAAPVEATAQKAETQTPSASEKAPGKPSEKDKSKGK